MFYRKVDGVDRLFEIEELVDGRLLERADVVDFVELGEPHDLVL